VASKNPLNNRAFIDCVRDYLPTDAVARPTHARGNAGSQIPHHDLSENTFYLFDGDAMVALCYAIEDVALEEANGTLLATFRDFKDFEPYRERVEQLSRTIDRVKIIGGGKMPKGLRGVTSIKDRQVASEDFCIVLYEGHRTQAMLMCRRVSSAKKFESMRFMGFYTFGAKLIRHMHEVIADPARGPEVALREFTRVQAIHTAAREFHQEFDRERETLNAAVLRLQTGGDRYRTKEFAQDLEKGLARLQRWKTRLPEMLARAEAD
jgi:hypothetical protein